MRQLAHMWRGIARLRGGIILGLLFALAITGVGSSVVTSAQAAPSAQLGPVETFTGTVVPGTIVPGGVGVRFNLERPSKANPAELEQLVIETAQISVVKPSEILSVTGNYDAAVKIFRATAITSLGNAAPSYVSSKSKHHGDNDNGSKNDNGDDDNDNKHHDDDDNDNGGNDNGDDDNDNSHHHHGDNDNS